jgi:hypothetical protein
VPLNPSGFYKGMHYTEWVEEVKRLKREEKFEECLELLFGLIEATENEAREQGWPYGAPWYYEHAAIIFRKLKRYEEEIEVLKRWKNGGPKFEQRIRAATALLSGKAQSPHEKKVAMYRNTCLKFSSDVGVSERIFEREHMELTSHFKNKGMTAPSYGDVFWKIADEQCMHASLDGDFGAVGRYRSSMAEFLVFEKRNWVRMAEESVRAFITSILMQDHQTKSSGTIILKNDRPYELTELVIAGCKCEKCAPDYGKRQSLNFFKDGLISPLPHQDCLKPPCSCKWTEPFWD